MALSKELAREGMSGGADNDRERRGMENIVGSKGRSG
jgi:hypothetical protein